MRMRNNSLLLMLGKSDLTVFVFSCRVFMWGILAELGWGCTDGFDRLFFCMVPEILNFSV